MQSTSQENSSNYSDYVFIKNNSAKELFCFADEVGRGPLAGPVVACSVFYKPSDILSDVSFLKNLGVMDSKKLSAKKRLAILSQIDVRLEDLKENHVYTINENLGFVLSSCSEAEIDEINILKASLLAMKRCLGVIHKKFKTSKNIALIDGNKVFSKDFFETKSLIKGDQLSLFISLASVIAKEYRDYCMSELDKLYPEYGLSKHAGYPTKFHKEAIIKYGITKIHRKSFKGVKEYV